MHIEFIQHASVRAGAVDLLCDPWFSGEVFNRAWRLATPGPAEIEAFAGVTHIWISHEHPDHLHFPTLKRLAAVCPAAIVLYRAQRNPNVLLALRALGFATRELDPGVPTALGEGFVVRSYPRGGDAALLVEAGARCLFNQNDCVLPPRILRRVRRVVAGRDLTHLFQFSLAGYYANADEDQRLRQAGERHLDQVAAAVAYIKPDRFVPFASFVRFCKPENAYLNGYHVSLDRVAERLGPARAQVLRPGDAVLFEDHLARSERNLAWWREVFARPVIPTVVDAPSAECLGELARRFFDAQRLPRVLRPGPTILALSQSRTYAALDCRGEKFEIHDDAAGPVAATVPDDEFAFFLDHPWGADTLNVTGTARIHRALAFRRLAYYRHGEYVLARWPAPARAFATNALALLRALRE